MPFTVLVAAQALTARFFEQFHSFTGGEVVDRRFKPAHIERHDSIMSSPPGMTNSFTFSSPMVEVNMPDRWEILVETPAGRRIWVTVDESTYIDHPLKSTYVAPSRPKEN